MIIRSRAPLRISFGGGGTDVEPYPRERGGVTISVTMNKYAYATLIARDDSLVNVTSLDYDTSVRFDTGNVPKYGGDLDLVKAVIKVLGVKNGIDLFLHTDAPPGSGLGSSSAVVVGLLALFKHWLKLPMTDYHLAELAYHIEREELGIKGGRQDQYAATFGGFNLIEFRDGITIVNPLRIKEEIVNELQYRLMLCYTGKTRLSAGIIEDQTSGYISGKEDVVRALDETKALAIKMKDSLLLGHLHDFGMLLHETWCNKKKFSSLVTDPNIDALYDVALKKGTLGGKVLGAGGGGFLLLFCEFDKKHRVANALQNLGGRVMDVAFDFQGVRTWEVSG